MTGFHWLASYPKSGNTWMRLALAAAHSGAGSVTLADLGRSWMASSCALLSEGLCTRVTSLTAEEIERLRPSAYRALAAEATEPMLCKTHDANLPTPGGETLFPREVTLGAIYLVRDPRDVAVSFAHHLGADLDATIDQMASPDFSIGSTATAGGLQVRQKLSSWSGHVLSWLQAPITDLVVRFEDLLSDPTAELVRVVDYLGWNLPLAAVEGAVEATRFPRLQAIEEAEGFSERPAMSSSRFFRQGRAGGWRGVLTPAQSARILDVHGEAMIRVGYKAQ